LGCRDNRAYLTCADPLGPHRERHGAGVRGHSGLVDLCGLLLWQNERRAGTMNMREAVPVGAPEVRIWWGVGEVRAE